MAIDWSGFVNRGRVGIDWWVDSQNDTDYNVRFDIYCQTDYTQGYNYDVSAYIAGTPGAQGPFVQRLSGNTAKLMFSGWMWLKKKPGVTQQSAFVVHASGVGPGFGEVNISKYGDIPAGSSRPSAPGTPTASAILANGTGVTISWSASSSNGGSSITGYLLRYKEGSSVSGSGYTDHSTQNNLSRKVTGLTKGKTYTFWVYAKNGSADNSGYSNASGGRTVTMPKEPSTPSAPSVTFTAPNKLSVSWSAPSNGGSAITRYDLQYADNSSFSNATTLNNGTARNKDVTVIESNYGKTFWFRVRAVNAVGASAYSGSTSRAVPAKPSTPGTPTLTYTAPTTVKIAWSAPGNGGASITGYTVQYADNSSFTNAKTASVTGTSATVTDVTVGKTWYFRVLAKNSQGSSAYSSAANVLVVCGPRVRINGVWKNTIAYVRVSGVWKTALPYVRVSGAWKNGGG